MDEFGPRLPPALAIAIGVALLALLLGAGINASAVVAVGAVAAVLVAGLHPPERGASESPDTARQHVVAGDQAAVCRHAAL